MFPSVDRAMINVSSHLPTKQRTNENRRKKRHHYPLSICTYSHTHTHSWHIYKCIGAHIHNCSRALLHGAAYAAEAKCHRSSSSHVTPPGGCPLSTWRAMHRVLEPTPPPLPPLPPQHHGGIWWSDLIFKFLAFPLASRWLVACFTCAH